MVMDIDNPRRLQKADVIGRDGTKLGTVSAVYYDNNTDHPAWVAVRTGLFGTHVSVVPLVAAELRGEELHVPFDKQQLKTAPHHDPGLELSPQDEIDLFDHYGLPYHDPMPRRTPGMTAERAVGAVGRADEAQWVRDTSGAVTDDAMTRSEERLRVRTESQPAGRVRLRKHVVTEYQQVTVPVRREEIRLEREPAVDPDPDVTASTSDDGTPVETRPPVGSEAAGRLRSDDEHVVTLYEERPVLGTETVPVERVRLGKQTVIEQQTVGGPVRREEIELDTNPDVDDPR